MIHFGFGCYVIRVMDMNLVVGLDVTIVAACLFALISCYLVFRKRFYLDFYSVEELKKVRRECISFPFYSDLLGITFCT